MKEHVSVELCGTEEEDDESGFDAHNTYSDQ